MTFSISFTDLITVLVTAAAFVSILFSLEYLNLLDVIKEYINKIYRSPIFIIIVLGVTAFISYIFNLLGLIEQYLTEIYLFIFSITLATYLVAFVAYSVYEGSLETSDPQPPLGWIANLGIGSAGGLIGEFLQVMGFFQASKLIVAGIGFGQWGLDLSFLNTVLINTIGIGLAAAAATSIAVRWLKLNDDWDAVIQSLVNLVGSQEDEVGSATDTK